MYEEGCDVGIGCYAQSYALSREYPRGSYDTESLVRLDFPLPNSQMTSGVQADRSLRKEVHRISRSANLHVPYLIYANAINIRAGARDVFRILKVVGLNDIVTGD